MGKLDNTWFRWEMVLGGEPPPRYEERENKSMGKKEIKQLIEFGVELAFYLVLGLLLGMLFTYGLQ